ncbi:Glucose-induced degradation complex subunit [Trebouxia sp. C0010 RCD-2024]
MAREAWTKKVISKDDWEKKLAAVKVYKEDMNKLVMDFLVTEGYVDAADIFQKESNTKPGVDLAAITDRMEIRKAVQSGDIQQAIERVNDLNPEILEQQHQLSFHLQQQRLIELIRQGKTEEALEHAQEYLAPPGEEDPAFLEELERTVTLLAFEDASQSPLADLMSVTQRQKTASELNAAILSSQRQETEPRLPSLLKLLVWAQNQLDARCTYPRINDLTAPTLTDPMQS